MYRERLLKLADAIEATPWASTYFLPGCRPGLLLLGTNTPREPLFGMDVWAKDYERLDDGSCQTVACIAGHACLLFLPDEPWWHMDPAKHAARVLGLDRLQANRLFTPDLDAFSKQGLPRRYPALTPQRAARAIRRLVRRDGATFGIWWAEKLDDE